MEETLGVADMLIDGEDVGEDVKVWDRVVEAVCITLGLCVPECVTLGLCVLECVTLGLCVPEGVCD